MQIRPAEAKPVEKCTGSKRTEALARVAREIAQFIAESAPPENSLPTKPPERVPSKTSRAAKKSSADGTVLPTTTAARMQLRHAVEEARNESRSGVDLLFAAFDPPMRSPDDVIKALEARSPVKFLPDIQEAIFKTYLKPGAQTVLDESAERVVVALTVLCLEGRVRELLGESAGSRTLPVDANSPALYSILGALLFDVGLVLSGADLHDAAPSNVLTDSAPIQLGHLTLQDALGAEALARSREQLFGIDRGGTLRDAASARIDPAEVRAALQHYARRFGGARLIAAIDALRLPQGGFDATVINDLESRFGLPAFMTEASGHANTREVALEIRRALEALSKQLVKARQARPTSSRN
jgi:hypothetical protein